MTEPNPEDALRSQRSMSRPTRRRGRGWGWIVVSAIVVGCSPPLTEVTGSGGSTGTTTVAATGPSSGGFDTSAMSTSSATAGSGGNEGDGTRGSSSTGELAGTSGGSTGPDACMPVDAGAMDYVDCHDGECPDEARDQTCLVDDTAEPVVFEVTVCAAECSDICECPVPTTGTAVAQCDGGRCTLDCSAGEDCPDGMICHEPTGRCMHSNVYVPCGDGGRCGNGNCVFYTGVAGICGIPDCSPPGGQPDDGLCPPPLEGNAVPYCFNAGSGLGLCILSCQGGLNCPEGMICVNNDCMYEFD